MSMVVSYAVGNGDMFSIRHIPDSFTIIDCSIADEDRKWIIEELKRQKKGKGISRFISTHPDQDHLMGLKYLDNEIGIHNFYCVDNNVKKADETDDFNHYCQLRDGDKAFYIKKGCSRKWLNESDEDRGKAGIQILWPDIDNADYKEALQNAATGGSPNNISAIIKYGAHNGGGFLWMGDLETEFMEKIEDDIDWPDISVLFAPHHGRNSGKIPESILSTLDPAVIIIGEAPSRHLNYYGSYNTITQNAAGNIAFENVDGGIHIYVERKNYSVDFLADHGATTYDNYIGTLEV
jgi:beta-lactamase superfamily II metal-dependent hydrolase